MQTKIKSINESKDRPGDRRNQEVVYPGFGDSEIGTLETPINSSGIVKAYIRNLPAFRQGLTPMRRGLEVGMAHGYWLIGPFSKLGPLRDTDIANLAGLLSTIGLIVISTIAISLYANSNPPRVTGTVAAPVVPEAFQSAEGWNEYGSGFLIGGIGGALFAYALLALDITKFISEYLFH